MHAYIHTLVSGHAQKGPEEMTDAGFWDSDCCANKNVLGEALALSQASQQVDSFDTIIEVF